VVLGDASLLQGESESGHIGGQNEADPGSGHNREFRNQELIKGEVRAR